MIDNLNILKPSQRAILVGVIDKRQDAEQLKEYMDELAFLSTTAGLIPVKNFTQKLDHPDPKFYIGTGKAKEIKKFIEEKEIDVVIFDDELSPSQQRNLEKELERKVIDRNLLILDIFAGRARSAHAKTQVELARYEYLLPRLTGLWTHLERQRGGTGTRGGSGEKEIETDRRIVRNRISALKEQLKEIDKQMATQRKGRGELVRVALVGYTNVGKSTIMNIISKSKVFAENKLFATLDTTVRKVVVGNLPFLLSDTVGFIRKLPHQLVESFKSTLDETREADILLHVVDISHPNFEDQLNVVQETLQEIGAGNKKTILVFNKIDAYREPPTKEHELNPMGKQMLTLKEMEKSWMSKLHDQCIFISAVTKENVNEFRQMLFDEVKLIHTKRYPNDKLEFWNK
ncbi:MAG TPA: GTPase HflX [Bacteroidia bacterium]|jgi:GTP-binding protein HflX|nr:GTPase HflX [Bacteroidia bacterium]